MNDPRESEKGIVLPLTALLMMVLIGFLGLALDFGYMLIRGGQVQNVADAIALSCSGANYRSADSCVTGDTNVSNPTYVGSVRVADFRLCVHTIRRQSVDGADFGR